MPRTSNRSISTINQHPKTVGERILQARQQLGLTQRELADPNLTASYISHIESNKSRPSLKTLAVLAERLGRPVATFLEGNPSSEQPRSLSLAEAYNRYARADYSGCYEVLNQMQPRIGSNQHIELLTLMGKAARRAELTDVAVTVLVEARQAVKATSNLDLYWALGVELSYAYAQQDQTVAARQLAAEAYHAVTTHVVRDPIVVSAIFARWVYFEPQADITAAPPYSAEFFATTYLGLLDQTYTQPALSALQILIEANSVIADLRVAIAEAATERHYINDFYTEALSRYRWADNVAGTITVLCRLADLALRDNHLDVAQGYATEADALARQRADARVHTEILLVRAEIADMHGDQAIADSCYADAIIRAGESNDIELHRRARLNYGEALYRWGQVERAVLALLEGARLVSA